MKLYEVLGRSYGYWILDTGELVRIEKAGGHMEYARDILGPSVEYIDAADEGWIRVVHSLPHMMFVDYMASATNEARDKLRTLLKYHKKELESVVSETRGFEGIPPRPANQFAEYIKSFDK